MLAFLLVKAYIKKSRRLTSTGLKWGTLGSAVRYNIVSSALTSLAKHATNASFATDDGIRLNGNHRQSSFNSDASVQSSIGSVHHQEDVSDQDEWVHFQSNTDFHAKNWRPQLLTIVDVDCQGTPYNLHVLCIASQLQQMGRGINVVISIIDRSSATISASVASAVNEICAEVSETQNEDESVASGISALSSERWRNEGESVSTVSSGLDHNDTIKLIRRTKALLMLQMKKRGMVSKVVLFFGFCWIHVLN